MLTEEYLKDNLIAAYFIDNERKNIEVLTRQEDQNISTIIPLDEKNPSYQALSKFITIDELHEVTYQKNKKDKEIYEQKIMEIAKRDGLLLNKEKIGTDHYPDIIKSLFEDIENEDDLFALKLAFFETDKVMNSKNNEVKNKLRKSKNKIEVIQCAIELFK
jgi:uncharacterized FAD-dependent dehydrogenase